MGVQPAVFASAGKVTQHYIPSVYSRRHNVPSGSGVSGSNLCIIGSSMGGAPLKMLQFSNAAEAKETLKSGDLLEAVANAFNGSTAYVPQYVSAMRVNNGTQSEHTLKNGTTEVLKIKSADYGVHQNQLKMWLTDGTDTGKKVFVNYKGAETVADNIEKDSFSIRYIGDAVDGVKLSINNVCLTLESKEDGESLTIAFEDCETLAELVTRLNDTDAYLATLLDTTETAKTNELDAVITTLETNAEKPTVLYSNVQALIDALVNIPQVGSVALLSAARVMPDNDDGFKYFTGGSHGTVTATDYAAALNVLENEDVQILSTASTNADVHSLISDHCVSMSSVSKKHERMFIVGMASGTSIDAGIAQAKALNTELGSLVITGANANSPLTGKAEDISPAIVACKCAGIESAMGISLPLTNKSIKVNSFSTKYKDSELEKLIAGGVMAFGENDSGELVCIRGVTTYKSNNLIMNERSMIRSVLYMDRDLRKAYSARVGSNNAPSESEILQILKLKARDWLKKDLITKAADGSLIWGATVKFNGDKCYITYSRYIRAPNNFIFITGTNEVYSSTVEV